MLRKRLLLLLLPFFIFSLGSQKGVEKKWVSLFNGRNLDHWQPKIAGCKLGEITAIRFVLKTEY